MIGLAMMATASFLTGQELYEKCSDTDDVTQLSCIAFIIGATSGIQTGAAASDASKEQHLLCLPEHINGKVVVDTVKAYLKSHPEYRDGDASLSVFGALYSNWRCPAK